MVAETKPFWMDDAEWQKRYPQMPAQDIGDAVAAGVPDLHEVKKGDVIGAWTKKDDLLIYHFYKADRKKIFDEAHAEMDRFAEEHREPQRSEMQGRVAKAANEELEQHPWWDNFEQILREVFSEHFKYRPNKITFYREVDSWSVIMPDISTPVSWSEAQYEKPFSMVALRVMS
jgi:hypothetical protein